MQEGAAYLSLQSASVCSFSGFHLGSQLCLDTSQLLLQPLGMLSSSSCVTLQMTPACAKLQTSRLALDQTRPAMAGLGYFAGSDILKAVRPTCTRSQDVQEC